MDKIKFNFQPILSVLICIIPQIRAPTEKKSNLKWNFYMFIFSEFNVKCSIGEILTIL